MFQSRISVIEGHHRDTRTDQLYEPLRKTFLLDTTAKKTVLDDASRVSHLSHSAQPHTYQQNHNLGQQTLFYEDADLKPTHDLSLLPVNRKYNIINAQQKKLEPISAQQFEKQTKGKLNKEQIIVYTYGKEDVKVTAKPLPEPVEKQPKERRKSTGIKVTQPKYNLFSVLDEPFNNLLTGKSCTCPANQLVASQRSEINWQNIKKQNEELF